MHQLYELISDLLKKKKSLIFFVIMKYSNMCSVHVIGCGAEIDCVQFWKSLSPFKDVIKQMITRSQKVNISRQRWLLINRVIHAGVKCSSQATECKLLDKWTLKNSQIYMNDNVTWLHT